MWDCSRFCKLGYSIFDHHDVLCTVITMYKNWDLFIHTLLNSVCSHCRSQFNQLQTKVSNGSPLIIRIRRGNLFKDALSEAKKDTFNAAKKIKVSEII